MLSIEERLKAYDRQGILGKWHLEGTLEEAFLGRGSYGRVYKIYYEGRNSRGFKYTYENALKILAIDVENCLPEANAQNLQNGQPKLNAQNLQNQLDGYLKKAENEIKIMEKLRGESNIVFALGSQIIERRDTRERSWDVLICMERLILLKDYLRGSGLVPGTMPYLQKVLYIWEELAAALCVCEKNAIVHRDVKPANVFYSPSTNHFKLSDFGEVVYGEVKKKASRHGTKFYMAPEIYNAAGADGRADAFSLAVSIYELLNNGNRPYEREARRQFPGATDKEIEEQVVQLRIVQKRPIPPVKGVPADVNSVLLKCLQYDPEKRFENSWQLKDEITKLRIKYKNASTMHGRSRLLLLALGAAALAALGVGAFFVFNSDSSEEGALPAPTAQEMEANASEAATPQPGAEWILEATEQPASAQAPTESAETPAAPVQTPMEPAAQPEAMSEALQVSLYFENGGAAVDPGEMVDVTGGFDVAQGEAVAEELQLTVNGTPVQAEIWEEEQGRFGIRAQVQIPEDGSTALQIALCNRASGEVYASEAWAFAATTPEPAPTLHLILESPVERTQDEIYLRGAIVADMPVDWECVSLRVNGMEWPFEAEVADDNRCLFTAEGSLEDAQDVEVEVYFSDAGKEAVGRAEVPVATPAPTPVLTLSLDQESVNAGVGEITLSGRVSLGGGVLEADALGIAVNGNQATANWEESDDGYTFIVRLDMDLTETETLEVRVQALGNDAVAPVQVSLPVLQPTAAPAVSAEPALLESIAIEGVGQLDGTWLGAGETLVLRGTAAPDEALDVSLNEKIFGSYVVDTDGTFMVEIPVSLLAQGENGVRIAYARNAAVADTVELTVGVDTMAPELYVRQQSLCQHDTGVFVRIAGEEAACEATLRVDGNDVCTLEIADAGWVLLPLGDTAISEQSVIEVVATDRAGNLAEQTVPFVRTAEDIRVRNMAALTNQVYGPAKPVDIVLTAEPDSLLRIAWGDCIWEAPTGDADAFFRLTLNMESGVLRTQDGEEIPGSAAPQPVQGENTVGIEYISVGGQPMEGLSHTEIRLNYDALAPELSVLPERILTGEQSLQLMVAGETMPWEAEITLDGETVWRAQASAGAVECTVELPQDVEIPGGSELLLCVRDAAGNEAWQSIPVETLTPIIIENAADFGGVLGPERAVILEIGAEAGAQLELRVNGQVFTIQQSGGVAACNIMEFLSNGENNVEIHYAEENGYPSQAMTGTETSIVLWRDTEAPQVNVEPALITRDTKELSVNVSNEANGYMLQLWIDGVLTLEGENTATLPVPSENALTEDSEIRVVVTDTVGNTAQVQLSYEDSSVLEEALVESYNTDLGEAAPGESFATDIFVLCSDYDMSDGYITVHLENDGGSRACVFARVPAEDAQRLSELYARGMLDSDYANAAYAITDVIVPQDCPGGDYRLVVRVESEHETYAFEVGAITVESQEDTAQTMKSYIDMAATYAIGLDPMMQGAFREDSIVLTGWVCRQSGTAAYFGRYEVLDSLGRVVWRDYNETESGELIQFDRRDVNEKVPGLNDCALEDAGFVLNLDLTDAGLADGQTYTIQIYSSNETGMEWETVRAAIRIDSAAEAIAAQSVESLIQDLTPPPLETEEPQADGAGEATEETEE